MPLTDSQLAGLIQVVLTQQEDIVVLKAGVLALLEIALEAGLPDVETRFQAYSSRHIENTTPESSLAPIRALHQVLLQLQHPGDPAN